MSDILNGMKEIARYLRRSESTVLAMHKGQDLPMRKSGGGGVWISSKKSIDEWNQKLLNGQSTLVDEPTEAAKQAEVTDTVEIAVKGNGEAIKGYLDAGYERSRQWVEEGAQKVTLTLSSPKDQ